ncbi:hypothetical protein TRFO_04079 [Tritrichomonas foetus]|uniref:VPS9 domain-containing protein n=1 Tax=Tritrichomonas foetus TaxID=1144522 RepID=A0A1J4KIE3_9EUKA|nr:hypothetical protein TRFO_04079 [Tritrichomonas foetus]|eukprot:OHT11119.1 hypothetical protein TRFO_04079 [Tritrichomonas foetus]
MGFPDEVYVTLSSNSQMVPFVSVVQYNGDTPYDYLAIVSQLTSFYNYTLLKSTKPDFHTLDCSYQANIHRMMYHKIRFIENKIYRLRTKHREKMIDFANYVIEFLSKWPPTEDNMIISVKIDKLQEYLQQDPPKVELLKSKYNFYMSLLKPVLESLKTKEQALEELKGVIETISQKIDPRTSFFPTHKLQLKFERLFMSPLLPFKDQLEELLMIFPPPDPQMFLKMLFSLVPPVLNEIGINKKPFDSTLVLLLVRLSFDKVYEQNEFLRNDGTDLLHELSDITFGSLRPPPEFSPKVENDEVKIIDVFRNDEHFKKAVQLLENVIFFTNPFDILDCIDLSLLVIEEAATVYNNYQTMVFPFEVTFELFMAVTIASQIRNWENLSVFVENYTPMTGLCPSFEFSKAKIVASVMQFQTMVAELHGEETGEYMRKASDFVASFTESMPDPLADAHDGIVVLPEIHTTETKDDGETLNESFQNPENEENEKSTETNNESNVNALENGENQRNETKTKEEVETEEEEKEKLVHVDEKEEKEDNQEI